jgi:hypothetical protein
MDYFPISQGNYVLLGWTAVVRGNGIRGADGDLDLFV